MATILLKYGQQAKPVLTDRNGEAVGNWAGAGNHSITASADYAHGGTKSLKIVASDAGDDTTNYVKLPSANNATFVAGTQYGVVFWARAAFSIILKVKTGGVTSSNISLVSTGWVRQEFIFTAVTATTDLQMWLDQTATAYIDDITVTKIVSLTVLSERGMSDPDMYDFFPGLQYKLLDGTIKEYINGFRRKILVDVGVVASSDDRKRILYWMLDTSRVVDYLTESDVTMALEDVGGYRNNWLYDCSLMRQFTFVLQEPSIRTTFPV